jgi:xylulokinase
MLLLGIDVGTSSIKVSVIDGSSQNVIASAQYPDTESEIISLQTGWAEQSPDQWWSDVQNAIKKANATGKYNPKEIGAIGIAYQMHGLVLIDKEGNTLRNSIIWCDSRAVPYGEAAFEKIGKEKCLQHLLNSPGNFTAAKLAWVKEQEPELYQRIDKVLLPGDFIAYKFTGVTTTTASALSEGIFWDFQNNSFSADVLNYFGFSEQFFPVVQQVFSNHGTLSQKVAETLGLKEGIPIAYKAGDQPNNALSLNVLNAGEVAATAGTSGVIYGVSDQLVCDQQSRLNSFAHVNHTGEQIRTGVLLCINGTGIMNRYIKQLAGASLSYEELNRQAGTVAKGSNGLHVLPFGNGAERIFNNKIVGAHFENIDLNKHKAAHFFRAAQEGIAFAFKYGFDIMQSNGMQPTKIRAGKANMFLSNVFAETFVNVTGVPVELYEADGSIGAAKGAGIGSGFYTSANEACSVQQSISIIEPAEKEMYRELYEQWYQILLRHNI